MENNIENRLTAQEEKINAILNSVRKIEKYFRITLWVTILMFVVPLLGLLLIIPAFIASYTISLEGLI